MKGMPPFTRVENKWGGSGRPPARYAGSPLPMYFAGGHPPNPPKRRRPQQTNSDSAKDNNGVGAPLRSAGACGAKTYERRGGGGRLGQKKMPSRGGGVFLKQFELSRFFVSWWGRAVPMMKGVVGLPNPSFAVCKSGDAVK